MARPDTELIQKKFLEQMASPAPLMQLFEYIPDVYFWIKDTHFKYIFGNQALHEKTGMLTPEALVGKTDLDFYPFEIASKYQKDDLEVMSKGLPIVNRIELVLNEDRTIGWYSTNKVVVLSKTGKVMGTAGTTRPVNREGVWDLPYREMSKVVDYISGQYANRIDIQKLAEMSFLSLSQFERKFKQAFKLSPLQFIIKVRIKSACRELLGTDDNITTIALRTGFESQKYFSRLFLREIGVSPKDYRANFRDPGKTAPVG